MKALTLVLTTSTIACATASLPSETPLTAEPVVVNVPKDLEDADSSFKGLHFEPIDRLTEQDDILPGLHSTNNPIKDFFSVSFLDTRPGELTTRICRGEQYSDGKRDGSCIFYDAHVALTEEPDRFRITVTPYRVRTEQGRNAIFVPIALPRVALPDWYRYMSAQTVAARHKIISKFGPESIKGNFDRHLHRSPFSEGEANGPLRQFKDTYAIEAKDSTTWIGAAFYPYRDGALVEVFVSARAHGQPTASHRDWSAELAALKARLDGIATE